MPLQFSGYQTRTARFQQELESPLNDVLGATAEQAFSELPINSMMRIQELATAGRGVRLSPEDAKKKITDAGLDGHLQVPYAATDGALDILIDRKKNELRRQDLLSRAPSGIGASSAQLGTALAASMLDPLNVGLAFVPAVGEARYMRMLANARGVFGRTAVRVGVGGIEGATGAAIIEPLTFYAKTQEQADYDFQDSMLNVAFGTAFGGGLHAVSGGIGDAVTRLTLPDREAMLRTAVSQAMQGREVEINPVTPRGFDSKIPRADNLSAADRDVEHALAEKVERNLDASIDEYASLPDSEGGKVLNTDTARELSPKYRADRTRSAAVHEPSSWIVKQMYARKLKEPIQEGQSNSVLFTGGGTGAGKSSGLKLMGDLSKRSPIIYDTNLNGLDSAVSKIEQALKAGREVDIVYTYRDPIDALKNGALPRAMRMGRTVPIEEHAKTHVGGAKTVKQLAEKYKDNPRVNIQVIDNTHGKDGARLGQIDAIPELDYDSVLGGLNEALETERQAGRISEAVYQGTRTASKQRGASEGNRAGNDRQLEQGRAREAVDAAHRQDSPESDVTADAQASAAADQQLKDHPPANDELAEQEQFLADEEATLKEAAKIAGIDLTDELSQVDESLAEFDTYAKAARAAVACGINH